MEAGPVDRRIFGRRVVARGVIQPARSPKSTCASDRSELGKNRKALRPLSQILDLFNACPAVVLGCTAIGQEKIFSPCRFRADAND